MNVSISLVHLFKHGGSILIFEPWPFGLPVFNEILVLDAGSNFLSFVLRREGVPVRSYSSNALNGRAIISDRPAGPCRDSRDMFTKDN